MIRYRDGREILASDLESRYGKDDPIVREVRASIPKERVPPLAPTLSGALTRSPDFATRSARFAATTD